MNGMISWFARNSMAANLLMVFIVCTGVIGAFSVRTEICSSLRTTVRLSTGVIR